MSSRKIQMSAELNDKLSLSICIDGWSGAGKTSLCALLSQCLGMPIIHTGMFYRAITCEAIKRNMFDERSLTTLAYELLCTSKTWQTCVETRQSRFQHRTELWSSEVTEMVPEVASNRALRETLRFSIRRYVGITTPSILEGRDTAQKIVPEAVLKIYLDCPQAVRLARVEDSQATSRRDARDSVFLGDHCRPVDGGISIDTSQVSPAVAAMLIEGYYREATTPHSIPMEMHT